MPKRHVIRPDVKAQILKRLKEDGVPVATASRGAWYLYQDHLQLAKPGHCQQPAKLTGVRQLKKENQMLKELVGNLTLYLDKREKKDRSLRQPGHDRMSK